MVRLSQMRQRCSPVLMLDITIYIVQGIVSSSGAMDMLVEFEEAVFSVAWLKSPSITNTLSG